MTPATSRILQALELKGLSPVQNGHGWKSRCPGHDDDKPSLSISDADNGGCVLKCFAGCSNLKVVAAIGLKLRDLMPDDGHGHAPASSRASTPPPLQFEVSALEMFATRLWLAVKIIGGAGLATVLVYLAASYWGS